jgi:murein DD-endopeptidase MepM/ murein hydrolase activator NlpD
MQKGSVAVAAGQQMAARAVIGWLGNSGNSTNLHLHFGLLAASARNQGGDRWESSRRSVAVLVH